MPSVWKRLDHSSYIYPSVYLSLGLLSYPSRKLKEKHYRSIHTLNFQSFIHSFTHIRPYDVASMVERCKSAVVDKTRNNAAG